MIRREFLSMLSMAMASQAFCAPPQNPLRLGVLVLFEAFDPDNNPIHRALVEGLRSRGYEPGRHFTVEARSAAGNPERLPALASELVRAKVDILITLNVGATLAAREATHTIPIVMLGVPDPVETGVVESLARPRGNVTGLATNMAEISAKRVQLLKEAVPSISRVAVLWNSSLMAMTMGFREIEAASPKLGVAVDSIGVTGSNGLDDAFAAIAQKRPQGLIVLFGPMRGNDLPRIVDFVTTRRIPTVFEVGRGTQAGGLIEFGSDQVEMARQVGEYVDKLANGARPADLPVQEPTTFVLVINLKAARAMGIEIPPSLVMRATRVIQ